VFTFPALVGASLFLQMDIMRLARVRGGCTRSVNTQESGTFLKTVLSLFERPRFVVFIYALNLVVVVLLIECLVTSVAVVPRILLLLSRSSAIAWALVVCFLFIYRGVHIAHFADMAGSSLVEAGARRRRLRQRSHRTESSVYLKQQQQQQPVLAAKESFAVTSNTQTVINMNPDASVSPIPSAMSIPGIVVKSHTRFSHEYDLPDRGLPIEQNENSTIEDIHPYIHIGVSSRKRRCRKPSSRNNNVCRCTCGESVNNVQRITSNEENSVYSAPLTTTTTSTSSCDEYSAGDVCTVPKKDSNNLGCFLDTRRHKHQRSKAQANPFSRDVDWIICGSKRSQKPVDCGPGMDQTATDMSWSRSNGVHKSSTDETLVGGGCMSLYSISRDVTEQTISEIDKSIANNDVTQRPSQIYCVDIAEKNVHTNTPHKSLETNIDDYEEYKMHNVISIVNERPTVIGSLTQNGRCHRANDRGHILHANELGDVGYVADNETVTPAVVRKRTAISLCRLPLRFV